MPSAVAEALRTAQTFTRDQVAWLMSQAMTWGYDLRAAEDTDHYWDGYNARVAEEDAWAAEVLGFNAKDVASGLSRKWLRDQADVAARTPREGDHPGGPVEWDEEPASIVRGAPTGRRLRVVA